MFIPLSAVDIEDSTSLARVIYVDARRIISINAEFLPDGREIAQVRCTGANVFVLETAKVISEMATAEMYKDAMMRINIL